jgi:hypothetical protein
MASARSVSVATEVAAVLFDAADGSDEHRTRLVADRQHRAVRPGRPVVVRGVEGGT